MQKYNFDTSNAFISKLNIQPIQSGILDGLSFAVKDNIDIAGFKTSFGSKAWFDLHPPALNHALCVEQLLRAGAICFGKTIADEFTYSLDGENYFYGTPINPKAPDRIPGGSSSGSASAVACDLVDFALGTDCAGSIRVPASLCGIFGMRPTTHRISESGVLPFSPGISTVGVFSQNLDVLEKVFYVLLNSHQNKLCELKNIYLLDDAFEISDPAVKEVLQDKIMYLKSIKDIQVSTISLSEIFGEEIDLFTCNEKALRVLQSVEIWNAIGGWIIDNNPKTGPRFSFGMEILKNVDRSQLNEALYLCEKLFTRISQFIKPGDLFCYPTVPMIAPIKGELDNPDKGFDFYRRTMAITCFSAIAHLPEITMPVAHVNNIPVGLSLAGAPNQDEFLLAVAKRVYEVIGYL